VSEQQPILTNPVATPPSATSQAHNYAALGVIALVWLLSQFHVDMPPQIAVVFVALIGGGLHYLMTRVK
jgi:hypothetical protein